MRRLLAAALAVLLVVGVGGWLVAGALGGEDPPPREPWSAAPREPGAGDAPDPDLARFYGQQLTWTPCGDKDCARLTVPLDYDRPGGRTIELALLRSRALGQARGALVFNPGGPGAPGTDYVAQAGRLFGAPLRRAYDIVGFDPRGTGESAPVDCLSDAELDQFLALDPSPDGPAEVRAYTRWLDRFGRGCVESDAELAAHVSTVETARDLDVLRAALGQAHLDYLGASYGTALGATYAELFPDRVGRLVLDAAVDVSLTTREANLGQARGFQQALEAYISDCVDNVDGCYLGDSVDEGLDLVAGLLAEVDRSPLPTASGRELTVGHAVYGIALPLYDRNLWFLLSQALRAAGDGDGTALLALADLYASRTPSGYSDNSREAFLAINCLDDPTAVPPAEVRAQLDDFREASPTFGDFFAWSLAGCRGQVAESTEPDLEIDGSGAAPILVIGTTRDPATPYAWAEALAAQLDSGVLLTREGDGHTAYNSGNNDCIDDAVEAYLVEGTVPEPGTTC
ncbi:alpha/beta hydrolase [Nocardioides coralli]|uniref:alpha/beta hydrolase n=1 Tax=Nocardioides coralli TaxID=2872154 RepID=UPI001CA403E1|nr:alpha/beta hydrolase [Nocardioides coralli]QZY29389.1 alpha/beta hydrolase [Nocardioides coralli]